MPKQALNYQMRQYTDALTNYRRHGKANYKALTCWHLLTLATLGIRNKISINLIDSNEGDNH